MLGTPPRRFGARSPAFVHLIVLWHRQAAYEGDLDEYRLM
jgi:hypothetical protein